MVAFLHLFNISFMFSRSLIDTPTMQSVQCMNDRMTGGSRKSPLRRISHKISCAWFRSLVPCFLFSRYGSKGLRAFSELKKRAALYGGSRPFSNCGPLGVRKAPPRVSPLLEGLLALLCQYLSLFFVGGFRPRLSRANEETRLKTT